LLAVDSRTNQVYVRTLGLIYGQGYPGVGAGYTALDGTSGHILRIWDDTTWVNVSKPPPFGFARTDNGLRVVFPPSPLYTAMPSPALLAMEARYGFGVGQGTMVADQAGKLVAILDTSAKAGAYSTKLWIFDAPLTRLHATITLSKEPLALAFDFKANRILVMYLDSTQIFTLANLHYLATISHPVYLEAPLIAGYDNRMYDTDPVAVDTTLGRAVVVSGSYEQATIQIIDLVTRRVLRTLSLGTQPIAVQIDPVLHRAYILDHGFCEVNVLDLRSEKLVANVGVGQSSSSLAVDVPTGKAFVSSPGVPTSHVLIFPANTTMNEAGCWPQAYQQ